MDIFLPPPHKLWTCAACVCPHCSELSKVLLTEIKWSVLSLIPFVHIDVGYRITCSRCAYFRRIGPSEIPGAKKAGSLFQELDSGKIGVPEYLRRLDEVKFPTLQEYRAAATSWMCASCDEVVPDEMGECWNCKCPRPGFNEDAAPLEEGVTPPPPDFVRNKPFPWEQ